MRCSRIQYSNKLLRGGGVVSRHKSGNHHSTYPSGQVAVQHYLSGGVLCYIPPHLSASRPRRGSISPTLGFQISFPSWAPFLVTLERLGHLLTNRALHRLALVFLSIYPVWTLCLSANLPSWRNATTTTAALHSVGGGTPSRAHAVRQCPSGPGANSGEKRRPTSDLAGAGMECPSSACALS
jgi:hypothetical protein